MKEQTCEQAVANRLNLPAVQSTTCPNSRRACRIGDVSNVVVEASVDETIHAGNFKFNAPT